MPKAPKRLTTPRRANAPRAPAMFPHVVTIYNVATEIDKATFEEKTTVCVTILRGVFLDAVKAVNVRQSGLEGADAVDLYIPFDVEAVDAVTGKKKRYAAPLEFWGLDDHAGYWTLAITSKNPKVAGYTFFVKGGAVPPESVKPEDIVQYAEMAFDGVYNITKVDAKDYGGGMAHWEIGGA